eukprot:23397-Hanusia_phi.AAC.1
MTRCSRYGEGGQRGMRKLGKWESRRGRMQWKGERRREDGRGGALLPPPSARATPSRQPLSSPAPAPPHCPAGSSISSTAPSGAAPTCRASWVGTGWVELGGRDRSYLLASLYVMLLALNGITEAFTHASATPAQ